MEAAEVHCDSHNSCYHLNTSESDTFGGMGTSREFREEELEQPTEGFDTYMHGD
jgi:hypothetical protein